VLGEGACVCLGGRVCVWGGGCVLGGKWGVGCVCAGGKGGSWVCVCAGGCPVWGDVTFGKHSSETIPLSIRWCIHN
jgi:hypothetical protein